MQSNQPAPYVDVYMDEIIYEDLQEYKYDNYVTKDANKPDSILGRVMTDLLGLTVVYAATFIVCDVVRTMSTGQWTRWYWMFLGPWNFVTGTPGAKKLHELFGWNVTTTDCDKGYYDGIDDCVNGGTIFYSSNAPPDSGTYECTNDVIDDYTACMNSTKAGFEGTGCQTQEDAALSDCLINHRASESQCYSKYYEAIDYCEATYLPPDCYLDAIKNYSRCQGKGCDNAWYSDITDCINSGGYRYPG